jgi:hypothetical protein
MFWGSERLGGTATGENMTEQPPQVEEAPIRAATDLGLLINLITQVPLELVQAWSAGLDDEAVQAGLTQLNLRLQALFAAYRDAMSIAECSKPGPVALLSMALTDDELSSLRSDGPSDRTSLTAQMAVLERVVAATNWMQSPETTTLDIISGVETSLWDSGIFRTLADQIRLLGHIFVCSTRTAAPGERTWQELLDCAARAHDAGLPEAQLLYLRLALPPLSEALALASRGEMASEAPGNPTGLRGDEAPTTDGAPIVGEELVGVREAVALLVELSEGYGRGEPGDLGLTILLADGLGARLTRAVHARLFAFAPPANDDVGRGEKLIAKSKPE